MRKFFNLAILMFLMIPTIAAAAEEANTIQDGKTVSLHYVLKLDKQAVDDTHSREPMKFIYGKDKIMKGLEEGIKGLKAGDQKTVSVTPEKGFGEPDPNQIVEVPKERFPGQDIQAGMMFHPTGAGGENEPGGIVKSVSEKTVVLDFNHPLAGKTFDLDVDIVDVA